MADPIDLMNAFLNLEAAGPMEPSKPRLTQALATFHQYPAGQASWHQGARPEGPRLRHVVCGLHRLESPVDVISEVAHCFEAYG